MVQYAELSLLHNTDNADHILQATPAAMPGGLHELAAKALGTGNCHTAVVVPSLRWSAHQGHPGLIDPRATAAGDSDLQQSMQGALRNTDCSMSWVSCALNVAHRLDCIIESIAAAIAVADLPESVHSSAVFWSSSVL